MTEQDLVNLRRTIYLTIMSSLDFEECAHKLMKLRLQREQFHEIVNMLLECCMQEKSYVKMFGLLAERFCLKLYEYRDEFEKAFEAQYSLCHRLETNKMRNVVKLFSHLLNTHAIRWKIFESITMTAEDTTSSSRIFVKILFHELTTQMGLVQLKNELEHPGLTHALKGLFPVDPDPPHLRYSINFFTAIQLGALTERMRKTLADAPKALEILRQAEQERAKKRAAIEIAPSNIGLGRELFKIFRDNVSSVKLGATIFHD